MIWLEAVAEIESLVGVEIRDRALIQRRETVGRATDM